MKDKISKFKSLIKKYGILGTSKKVLNYVFSIIMNILHSLNFIENKKLSKQLDEIIESKNYDRIIFKQVMIW